MQQFIFNDVSQVSILSCSVSREFTENSVTRRNTLQHIKSTIENRCVCVPCVAASALSVLLCVAACHSLPSKLLCIMLFVCCCVLRQVLLCVAACAAVCCGECFYSLLCDAACHSALCVLLCVAARHSLSYKHTGPS